MCLHFLDLSINRLFALHFFFGIFNERLRMLNMTDVVIFVSSGNVVEFVVDSGVKKLDMI